MSIGQTQKAAKFRHTTTLQDIHSQSFTPLHGKVRQSSLNSRSKWVSTGQISNTVKFHRTPTKSVWNICRQKFLLPRKVDQSSQNHLRPPTHQCPHCAKFHCAWPNDVGRTKVLQKFFTPSVFWPPARTGPKSINFSTDVHQGPVCQRDKFRPLLTIRLQDICCQSS